jgi:hypothetical protein
MMSSMQALLATVGLLIGIWLALVLLSRAWVRSSRLGGYRATHRTDGLEPGPRVPEDDDVHWKWKGDKREP